MDERLSDTSEGDLRVELVDAVDPNGSSVDLARDSDTSVELQRQS